MSVTAKSLRSKLNHANQNLANLRNERARLVSEALASAEARINLFFDGMYGLSIEAAESFCRTIQNELLTELERNALAGIGAPYPLGTKLMKEIRGRKAWDKPGLAYGVVEAITRTSVHPTNESTWRRAQIGQYVVRYTNEKGSRKQYDTSFRDWVSIDPSVIRNEEFFKPKEIKV